MPSTIAWVTRVGALPPCTRAVQMTRSFLATVRGDELGLLAAELVGHFAGVGAGLAGGLRVLDAHEGGAEAT